ncbi:amidohydrolase family protein [Streptomyces sp. NPDC002680]|uniref:amidohydrolase family protein n=1 Tax=Streptomyces sp. NPDC002680 TaxID=3364659 RepID=UPI003678C6EE
MIEHFTVFGAAMRVGTITATHVENRIHLDFGVFNNGRGAKFDEQLRLNDLHLPLEWRIDGTSLMGGAVHERLGTDGHVQSWTSQAEEGSDDSAVLKLYLAADSSPYAPWIYARAALAAGGTIEALPAGSVRAERFTQVELRGTALDVYAVTGAALTPQYVLMDADERLIATGGGTLDFSETLVRDDFAVELPELTDLFAALTRRHLEQIQSRVRHRHDAPVRIRDVRVFDPESGTLTEPMSVTTYRGMITLIEPDASARSRPDEVVVDGAGGTLLAGLHDMHAHVSGWSALFYIAAGVTTIRDMGNENDTLLDLMTRIDAAEIAGPTVVPSGFIEGRSDFSMRLGVIPETLEEGLEAVRWYGSRGYHQIKLYNSMNPDWVAPLAAEAHRLGMRVVGHVPAFSSPDRVIADGYDEITHINQLVLGWLLSPEEDTRTPLRLTAMARSKNLDLDSAPVRHTVARMVERGVGLDTTTVILERLMLSRTRTVIDADQAYLDHMPVSYQRSRKRTYVPYSSDAELQDYDRSFAKLLDIMRLLHDHGVQLWPGTDDGTGFTLHRELELYAAAGLSPAEVLCIATRDCARHLGLGHSHGSIERGRTASFVLLDGDPTVDVSAIRNIRMVVRDGDLYFPHEIYRELNIEPFVPAPAVSEPGEEGRRT